MTEIRNVAMVGAGLMGHGLALVHALGGCRVVMQDISADQLAAAPGLIAAAAGTLVDGGAITAAERDAALARISSEPDLETSVAGADLVVEAVAERADVKREVYGRVAAAAPAHAILASNTSHLDIFPLVPDALKSRAAIAHWYTPPYIIDLVDVVGGPEAGPQVAEALRALYAGMGKKPIVFSRFATGYIANRLQAALGLEIYNLIDEGIATPEMIDDSIKYGLAARMAFLGHLKKADYTGLGLVRQSMQNATYSPPARRGVSPAVERLVADGRLGVMSGGGFFDYASRPPAEWFRARDRALLKHKALVETVEREDPM
jgi:3-hydroxybutyryl-CoA dehydrogenase